MEVGGVSMWATLKRAGSRLATGSPVAPAPGRHGPAAEAGTATERAARLEQTLQEFLDTLGPEHHRTIAARNNLAAKYAQSGRREAAIAEFTQALADSERALGDDDPQTDVIRENLAAALEDADRFEQAAQHWEVLLQQRAQRLGLWAAETVNARSSLAIAYRRTGRLDAATTHFERAIEDLADATPEQVESLRVGLALTHRAAGRFDATCQQLRMVVAMRQRRLGPQHPQTLTAQLHLGRTHMAAGRPEDAVQVLRPAYREALGAAGDPEVRVLLLRVRRDLARALRALGRIHDAAALG